MGEILLDARLVVGGLWPGALVERGTFGGLLYTNGGNLYTMWDPVRGKHTASTIEDPIALRLPGPLGLGAAGLLHRIAARVGFKEGDGLWWDDCTLNTYDTTKSSRTRWLTFADSELVTEHFDEVALPGLEDALDFPNYSPAAVSASLSMLDALCAAAGLALEPGEVARWTWTSMACWDLQTASGEHLYCGAVVGTDDETVVPALRITSDDPRDSLVACWEAVYNG